MSIFGVGGTSPFSVKYTNPWWNNTGGTIEITFTVPADIPGGTVSLFSIVPTYTGGGTISNAWLSGYNGGLPQQPNAGNGFAIETGGHGVPVLKPGDTITLGFNINGPFDPSAFTFDFTDLDDPATPGAPQTDPLVTIGTEGDDSLSGSSRNDVIHANNGTNQVDAGGGNNTVTGGNGDDTITTGAGNDTIHANDGRNWVDAGDGDNSVTGGNHEDTVFTGSGDDIVHVNGGNDTVQVGGGTNTVSLGEGDDTFIIDWTQSQGATNTVYAGGGTDTVRFVLTKDEAEDEDVRGEIRAMQAVANSASTNMHTFSAGSGLAGTLYDFERVAIVAPVVAEDDTAEANENDVFTIDVLANDRDLLGDLANLADDNAALTITGVTSTLAGDATVAVSGDGRRLEVDLGTAYDYLAVDETATVTLTYTIADDQGFEDTADVTLTINGTNDAPRVANLTGPVTVEEGDGPLTATGTFRVVDLDLSDNVTIGLTNLFIADLALAPRFDRGALAEMFTFPAVIDADPAAGNLFTWTFTAPPGTFDMLPEGASLPIRVGWAFSDGHTTVPRSMLITVTGTNDAPTLSVAADDSAAESVSEDAASAAGTLSAGDVDLGDVLEARVTGVTLAAASGQRVPADLTETALLGLFEVTADPITPNTGQNLDWEFTGGSSFDFLAVGESVTLTYMVEVEDREGATAALPVSITVTGANDGPAVYRASPGHTALSEDGPLFAEGAFTVTDADLSDTVTMALAGVTLSGDPAAVAAFDPADILGLFAFDATLPADPGAVKNATWSFTAPNGTFDALADGMTLTIHAPFTFTDGNSLPRTRTVTIGIEGTNDKPVVRYAIREIDLVEGDGALETGGTFTVTDVDLGTTIAVTMTEVEILDPAFADVFDAEALATLFEVPDTVPGVATATDNVAWTFKAPAGTFDALPEGAVLPLKATFTFSDGIDTVTRRVSIDITGTNDKPVVRYAIREIDLVEGDGALETGGTFTVTDVDLGTTIAVAMTEVEILDPAFADVFNAEALATLFEVPDTVPGTPTATDNVAWTFKAPAGTFDALPEGAVLPLKATFTFSDGIDTVTRRVSIDITGTNDAPVLTNVRAIGTEEDTSIRLQTAFGARMDDGQIRKLLIADPDGGGDTAYTIKFTYDTAEIATLQLTNPVNGPAALTATDEPGALTIAFHYADALARLNNLLQNGAIVATPAADWYGTASIAYTVTDGEGGTDSGTIDLVVDAVNDLPVVSVALGDLDGTTIDEENSATLSVSGSLTVTDVDPDDTVTARVKSVSTSGTDGGISVTTAQLLTFLTVNGGAMAADGETGNLVWSFDSRGVGYQERFDYLSADEEVTLDYVVELTDSAGATVDHVLSITIDGANDLPKWIDKGPIPVALQEADGPLTSFGSIAVGDRDLSDSLTITGAVTGVSGNRGTLTDQAITAMFEVTTPWLEGDLDATVYPAVYSDTADWSFTSGTETFDYLAAGETVTFTYTMNASDGVHPWDVTTSVELTITGTNDAPVFNRVQDFTTAEDTPIGLTAATRVWTGTQNLTWSFSDVDDRLGDMATVTFKIAPGSGTFSVNPTHVNMATSTVTMDEAAGTFTITSTGTVNRTGLDHINAIITGNGGLIFTPAADLNGTVAVGYTVSDGTEETSGSFALDVTPVNDAPELAITDIQGTEDTPIVLKDVFSGSNALVVADPDAADDASMSLTFTMDPADVSLSINSTQGAAGWDVADDGNGTVTLTTHTANSMSALDRMNHILKFGEITFTPTANFDETTTVSYEIADDEGGSSGDAFDIAFAPVNDPETIVTFDFDDGQNITNQAPTRDGFKFSFSGSYYTDSTPLLGYYTSNNWPDYDSEAYNGFGFKYTTIKRADGEKFQFVSAEFGLDYSQNRTNLGGTELTVNGLEDGHLVFSETVNTTNSMMLHNFPTDEIDQLDITVTAGGQSGYGVTNTGFYSVDNLVFIA
ncbi:beta strand repeat-containing protein [Acuticoccus yangtzensis]|uniref:beta strand repeat-containing protein n=1 Tax=Acuticoccus yangtzensis TaxID=1443441 RepID=UPI0009495B34|nr:tandem-95 repeat protein [Acuticoccus yangtzensis]